ncbi:O-methyltransferase-domain-containing protein [Kalaharituber pfeilii]|nr:O-methyltransferase-domain-containing protein [Kalaharituber pfeilii]
MHGDTTVLPNPKVSAVVHDYCHQHSTPLPESVDQHREDSLQWCRETGADSEMMISNLQSQLMIFFTKVLGVKRILEIGCFTGYSALAFAEALKGVPDAEITTLDLPGPSSDFALKSFQNRLRSPEYPPVVLLQAPADKSLLTLSGKQYDLIFIDADKRNYINYLKIILERNLLAPNGVLVADNALRRGLVADQSSDNPAASGPDAEERLKGAEAMDNFNKAVKNDNRLENVLLPIFDGLNFVKLRSKT